MVIETTYGKIEGTESEKMLSFLGIPFAAPPVGERRFMPPKPPTPWEGVLKCEKLGNACPQDTSNPVPILSKDEAVDEDCLYLNVFTPACDDKKRPVFFWVHGGAFQMGSAASGMSHPDTYTDEDIVVVACNYRIGAFGFMQVDHLLGEKYAQSGNCGMLDVIAALKWTQDNIERFGGDPKQITILGSSAGSKMVGSLMLSKKGQGLFDRAVMQSGAAQCIRDKHTAQAVADRIMAKLELSPENAGELLTMSWEKLIKAQKSVIAGVLNLHALGPVFDGINFEGDDALDLAKKCSGYTVLCGTCREEWNAFCRFNEKMQVLNEDLADCLFGDYKNYALATRDAMNAQESKENLVAMMSDYVYRNGMLRLADAYAQSPNHGDIYMYRMDYDKGPTGAAHGVVSPFVLGDRNVTFEAIYDREDFKELSAVMTSHWRHFIRYGKPNEDWEAYDPETNPKMMVFNVESGMAPVPPVSTAPEVPYCVIKL